MKTLKINRRISSTHLQIDELEKWVGKEVNIIIKERKIEKTYPYSNKAAGILSAFKDNDLSEKEKEKEGWPKAVNEKYGNS